jgi:hypothetical protein
MIMTPSHPHPPLINDMRKRTRSSELPQSHVHDTIYSHSLCLIRTYLRPHGIFELRILFNQLYLILSLTDFTHFWFRWVF